MGQNIQKLLNDLAAQAAASGASNFNSYEDPVKQSYEVSAYEGFLVSQGMDTYTAKVTAQKAASSPAIAAQIRQAMNASNSQGLGPMLDTGVPGATLAAANFSITVTRLTAAIVGESLPFAIFGAQDYCNGYRNTLQGMLAAGTVLTSVTGGEVNGKANQVDFTYTNGANVDIVRVTSDTYPYPSLLNSTNVDLLRMSKIRMELSDSTQASQFRQELMTVSNSPFGKSTTNKVSATAFRRPDQFQAGIVDIDAVFDIDKETAIVSKVLAVANFGITYNSFVQKFFRQNTKSNF